MLVLKRYVARNREYLHAGLFDESLEVRRSIIEKEEEGGREEKNETLGHQRSVARGTPGLSDNTPSASLPQPVPICDISSPSRSLPFRHIACMLYVV